MANWPGVWNEDSFRDHIERIKKEEERRYHKRYSKGIEDWKGIFGEVHVTPEGKVKEKVKKVLTAVKAYYIMPGAGGYGASGPPDFVVCLRGRFVGIECKAGKNTPTALQLKHSGMIQEAGGTWMVVNEQTDMTELQLKLIYLIEND